MLLLNPYRESSAEYANLYENFEKIKAAYMPVDISYTPGEPETVEKDGRLVVIQKEESVITMTDEQLSQIVNIIEKITRESDISPSTSPVITCSSIPILIR